MWGVHKVFDQARQVGCLARQDALQGLDFGRYPRQVPQPLHAQSDGGQGIAQLVRQHGEEQRLPLMCLGGLGLTKAGVQRGNDQLAIGLLQILRPRLHVTDIARLCRIGFTPLGRGQTRPLGRQRADRVFSQQGCVSGRASRLGTQRVWNFRNSHVIPSGRKCALVSFHKRQDGESPLAGFGSSPKAVRSDEQAVRWRTDLDMDPP